jgi:tetratricopeptide (TPR) repeat protein
VSWKIQAAESPSQPFLWGQPLFQYCDFLLDQGKSDEVIRIIERSSPQSNTLLFKALDHLALGRAHPPGSSQATSELDQAIAALRRAEQLDELPRGLLVRANNYRILGEFDRAKRDLDEIPVLVIRSGMRLYLADFHLEQARLFLAQGEPEIARSDYESAKLLVHETGYSRRHSDLHRLVAVFEAGR